MFIPIHDANRLRHVRLHYVTLGLIAANCIVFAVQLANTEAATLSFALIPATLSHAIPRPDYLTAIPEQATLLTYSFLHADVWHLAGNMVFLWVFGDNVEDAMGHLRFLAFYALCAVGAGLVFVFMTPAAPTPLVGASGAIAGVIAAYLILHPRVRVWILFLNRIPVRLSAAWVLGFWVLLQFWNLWAGSDTEIAWWAHIGGLMTGAVLVLVLRRRGVPLFDRAADIS